MRGKPGTRPGARRGPGRLGSSRGAQAFGLFICSVVSVLAISQAAHATTYGNWATLPDPSFGLKGVVVTQVVPGETNAATSVAPEPGGDVLVGGSAGRGRRRSADRRKGSSLACCRPDTLTLHSEGDRAR